MLMYVAFISTPDSLMLLTIFYPRLPSSLQYDMCREDYELNHKGQDKVLMRELNKYLVRPRKK
jgi:hypothetical protein